MANTDRLARRSSAHATTKGGFRLTPRLFVGVIAAILMIVSLYMMFMVAPTDANLGNVQRVFYLHVPIALMSFLAFSWYSLAA